MKSVLSEWRWQEHFGVSFGLKNRYVYLKERCTASRFLLKASWVELELYPQKVHVLHLNIQGTGDNSFNISIKKMACPIYNGTLLTFFWAKWLNYSYFSIRKFLISKCCLRIQTNWWIYIAETKKKYIYHYPSTFIR